MEIANGSDNDKKEVSQNCLERRVKADCLSRPEIG